MKHTSVILCVWDQSSELLYAPKPLPSRLKDGLGIRPFPFPLGTSQPSFQLVHFTLLEYGSQDIPVWGITDRVLSVLTANTAS
jgi:hypothetical protein